MLACPNGDFMDGALDPMPQPPVAQTLTAAHVAELSGDRGDDGRSKAAARVAGLFSSGMLSASEHEVALEILETLAQDAAEKVRTALSEHVKHCPSLPRGLARQIASDIDAVALPFLEVSQALTDEDLIDLIRSGTPSKQISIAKRPVVTAAVSDALVETRHAEVVNTLLDNPGARIADETLHKVVAQSVGDEGMQARIARRPVLPLAVTERLIAAASDRIRDYIVKSHGFPAELAGDIAQQGKERVLSETLSHEFRTDQVSDLVSRMIAKGELTPTLVLRGLCIGDTQFFESALAALTGNSPEDLRAIILNDEEEFRRVYRNAGLPDVFQPAFVAAIRVLKEDETSGGIDAGTFTERVIEAMMSEYGDVCPRDLEHMLSQLSKRLKKAA